MMRIHILKSILFCFFSMGFSSLFSQNVPTWTSLSGNISNPDTISFLLINFSAETNQFSLLEKFGKMENLWLQEMQNEDVEKLKPLKKPISLIISDSPDLDMEGFFSKGIDCSIIREMYLQGNQLGKLPSVISKSKNLEKISVTDNDDFDLLTFFDICKSLPSLTNINLSGNRLTSLPSKVTLLNNIRVINLKENLLETTGSFFKSFPKLDSLMAEGNIFNDLSEELLNINSPEIKYISLDSSVVYDENWNMVKSKFPNTEFVLVPDINISTVTNPNGSIFPDSVSFTLKTPEDTAVSDSSTIGYFMLEKSAFQILSDAYLHYPDLFLRGNLSFDSSLFEERFWNLDYINNKKRSAISQIGTGSIRIKFSNKWSQKYFFNISVEYGYITKNYNELFVYNNITKWGLDNNEYNRRDFKRKFIGSKRNPVKWNDIKIEFNALNKKYQIILKNDTSFFYLDCFIKRPANKIFQSKQKKNGINEQALEKAELRNYIRYLKLRSNREKKWDKSILKDADKYYKAFLKITNNRWYSFQQMYMSDKEKAMTMGQWLQYYEKIIADEPAAIRNSDATLKATERALEIDGYKGIYMAMLATDTLPIEAYSLQFTNKENKILAIKKIIVLLPERESYYSLTGTFNSDYISVILPKNEKVMFISETIGGSLAVASSSEVETARKGGTLQFKLPMQVLDKKIATVGQVDNILQW